MTKPSRKRESRICETCGTEYTCRTDSKQRPCSRSCGGVKGARRGADNHRWNGGLSVWKGRTIVVFRDGGHMLYSRAVMAGHVGRLLTPQEIVHHKNEDPTDDRIENLQIVTRAEHAAIHRAMLNESRMAAQRKADRAVRG